MKKRILSIVLSLAMIISLSSTLVVFADGDNSASDKKNYVFIGDSMSYNYPNGRHFYSSNLKKIYPQYIADQFKYNLLNNEEPQGSPLTKGGMRTTEAYVALSSWDGDGFTQKYYGGISASEKQAAVEYIKNADVVTIKLGQASVTTYALNNILNEYGMGGKDYGSDPSKYYDSSDIASVKPFAKKAVDEIINNDVVSMLSAMVDLTPVRNTLEYTLIAHMIDFDRLINQINTINPNAEINVIGLDNPASKITIKALKSVKLNNLINPIFKTMNDYESKTSKCRGLYNYISETKNIQSFADLMAKDKKATKEIVKIICGDDNKATKLTPKVMHVFQINSVDVMKAITSITDKDEEYLEKINIGDDKELLDIIDAMCQPDKKGKIKLNEFEKLILFGVSLTIDGGLSAHPTQAGHATLAKHIIGEIMAARNTVTTSLTSVKGSSKSITAKWNKKSNVDGYQLQCSTSSSYTGAKSTVVKGSKTTATIKKLKSGKKYYVRVRTYKTIDGAKNYSRWSKNKTTTVK